ncbi:MAG: TolB family protein [Phocaeicola sp.]|uniref:TolB family protein n=1 Tax=Phocaeicola sp. TaxID=2773926 RepID=UPI003F9F2D62
MSRSVNYILAVFSLVLFAACKDKLPEAKVCQDFPEIFPDYRWVTVPVNIASLNFKVLEGDAFAVLKSVNDELIIKGDRGAIKVPVKKWHQLLADSDSLEVTVYQKNGADWIRYKSFPIYVSKDSIDNHLVYRRIAPVYRLWNQMGIYQRNLENFEEKAILENSMTDHNCMNCHSFRMQSPDIMLFHQRSTHPGTYIAQKGKLKSIKPSMDRKFGMVYPYWYPSGDFIAFSSNDIKQDFHFSDPNRIEVFDNSSDVVIYDIKENRLFTDSILCSRKSFETYPSFSSDGRQLYFCTAPSMLMPEHYKDIKYSLVSVGFDAERKEIGQQVDTIFNSHKENRSTAFPRQSPDGRYLLYTVSDYGNFFIWHRDADLKLLDLQKKKYIDMDKVNSDEADSYHSWSSNSRWFVFSSRRVNGLYTRPYICHISNEGTIDKPFLLPQEDPDYYISLLQSFNIPELVKGEIESDPYAWALYTGKQ